jgi:hypothetical protein
MWKGVCFALPLGELSNKAISDKVSAAPNKGSLIHPIAASLYVTVTVSYRLIITIDSWDHTAPTSEGLNDNNCWLNGMAPQDPEFLLLSYDP